jgi:hypothetical protein
MSQQSDVAIANQGFADFRAELNLILAAFNTNHSGSSRPSSSVAGSFWLDSSIATAPILKHFDGADDIAVMTFNYSTNTVTTMETDILRANVADNLTKGFSTSVFDAGTKTSGTFTPDQDNGNIQKAVNNGAHTLAPTTDDCAVIIQYTNAASAGTITTSGFTLVDGDDISTTNADDFFFYLTKANGFSLLTVKALQ